MFLSSPRVTLSILTLAGGAAFAQTGSDCTTAQRALESIVKEYPEKAVETLSTHTRRNPACAGALVESAITSAQASDELVAELVTAAIRSAPEKAVVIAESAITAAPTSSDEVAEVVQKILGDCQSIAEDVTISIGRNRDRLLIVLEDALRSHGNCACEIVGAAVRAADGSATVVSQIVEMSVLAKPSLAAEISECASAAAPRLSAAVQKGLDNALSDSDRGVGSLPAAVAFEETPVPNPAPEVEDPAVAPTEDWRQTAVTEQDPPREVVTANEVPENAGVSPDAVPPGPGDDGAPVLLPGAEGYGKNGEAKGKNAGHGKEKPEIEVVTKKDDWGWDWIHWGALSANNGAVYMIAPSGGIVPPGVFAPQTPLSPSDPKFDEKYDPKYDDKSDPKDDKKDPGKLD